MRRHRFLAAASAVLLAVTLGVALPRVAGAEEHPPVTLTDASQTAAWSGRFVAGAVPVPEACTPELCDVVPLDVRLPDRTWEGQPGGMLVAIQTPDIDWGYDLDLFVYAPDGSVVASESTYVLRSRAVWIPDPVNGTYTVVVMPSLVASQPVVDGVLEPFEYAGFVEFEHGVTVQREELNSGQPYNRQVVASGLTSPTPAVELLPDLVPTTPRNFHIESTVGANFYFYADRGLRHQPSCYPEETLGLTEDEPDLGNGPQRCLRWDQGEHNFGDGPFQLHIYEGTTDVYQRIYRSDGSVRQLGPLGEVRYSRSHLHFHYVGFQEIKLYRIDEAGSRTFVKNGLDKGICMVDIENTWFGRTDRPTSPLGYPIFGTCDDFTHQDPNDPTFPDRNFLQMGISVGYADVYPWYIADQYIDITDVPDGNYAIVVRQDVDNRVLEKDKSNNTAMGCVRIDGDEAVEIPCEHIKGIGR